MKRFVELGNVIDTGTLYDDFHLVGFIISVPQVSVFQAGGEDDFLSRFDNSQATRKMDSRAGTSLLAQIYYFLY